MSLLLEAISEATAEPNQKWLNQVALESRADGGNAGGDKWFSLSVSLTSWFLENMYMLFWLKMHLKHLGKSLAEDAHLSRDTELMYVTAQRCQSSS